MGGVVAVVDNVVGIVGGAVGVVGGVGVDTAVPVQSFTHSQILYFISISSMFFLGDFKCRVFIF